MKTGDIKVIDERFVAPSPAASWDEYFVLERFDDGCKLDIRVYDCLGEINGYEKTTFRLLYPKIFTA